MGAKNETIQYAALPFRIVDGQPEILMVTSRETKRWILPKGKPERKKAPALVAANEAYEEGGVKGRVSDEVFGAFTSAKRLPNGREIPFMVHVFLLEVDEELAKWPEMKQRERRWINPGDAALIATEPGLAEILLEFSGMWR